MREWLARWLATARSEFAVDVARDDGDYVDRDCVAVAAEGLAEHFGGTICGRNGQFKGFFCGSDDVQEGDMKMPCVCVWRLECLAFERELTRSTCEFDVIMRMG